MTSFADRDNASGQGAEVTTEAGLVRLAVDLTGGVAAVVSRGGRPGLAGSRLDAAAALARDWFTRHLTSG